jgi:hypothetical protein
VNYKGVYDRNPGSTNTMKFNLKSMLLVDHYSKTVNITSFCDDPRFLEFRRFIVQ